MSRSVSRRSIARRPWRCSTSCGSPRSWPARGAATRSTDSALAGLIVAVCQLAMDRPDIVEIDLNPVVADAGGAIAVDALVVLAEPGSS